MWAFIIAMVHKAVCVCLCVVCVSLSLVCLFPIHA